jgi:uncharacterized membrane protein YkoI
VNRRLKRMVVATIAIGAIAGGGAALAAGADVGSALQPGEVEADDRDEQVGGPDAKKAVEAARAEVGRGTVTSVEAADDGDSGFEVEITKADGQDVEVNVDGSNLTVEVDD